MRLGRWGGDLAICLPDEMVDAIRLRDGERVEIEAREGKVVIWRARLSHEDLFRGKSPDARRADYARAYDWGADVGREVIRK